LDEAGDGGEEEHDGDTAEGPELPRELALLGPGDGFWVGGRQPDRVAGCAAGAGGSGLHDRPD
jgi:hypothetical protein